MNIGLILAWIATALLIAALPRIRRTTLLSPWCWLIAAIWAMVLSHSVEPIEIHATDRHWYQALQYSAHALIFCPFMSLLGARRPQNKMWELVVLTLWIILVLPALEAIFIRPGQIYDTQGIRASFMLILILVSSMNIVLGRFWICGVLLACAQLALVNQHLPDWCHLSLSNLPVWGMGFAIAALSLVLIMPRPDRSGLTREDRVWLDFRDMFGGMWALRIRDRINVLAKNHDWDLRLEWHGFCRRNGDALPEELPEGVQEILHLNFWNLMRKFISQPWLDARLNNHRQ